MDISVDKNANCAMHIVNEPLVSIIMATFNESAEMITLSISSILKQTYRNLELLIFDDSTNTETIKTIEQLAKDTRVKVFRSEKRVGFVPSLNKGLETAAGKYIARMDGDDISFPTRIEKEVDFLESHKDVYVVGGQINIIDENGTVKSSRRYPQDGVRLYLFSAVRNPLAHPTVMMRRELVDKGFRYDEKLKMSEDLDLWLRVLNQSYKIANIPETVLNYRVASNFIEKRSNRTQVEYMANVRRKNFDRKHLLHSCVSATSAWLFMNVPVGAIKKLYRNENKQ